MTLEEARDRYIEMGKECAEIAFLGYVGKLIKKSRKNGDHWQLKMIRKFLEKEMRRMKI